MSFRVCVAASAAFLLSACGSGPGSPPAPSTSGPPAAPVNRPPTISSTAATPAPENEAYLFRVSASDPENSAITFSLSGADAARFAILESGDLSMVEIPDFEDPLDADRNNIYDVRVTASDGSTSSSVDLAIQVTDRFDTIRVRRIATGFNEISAMAAAPPANLVVAERTGRVYFVDPSSGTRFLAFTVNALEIDGERGVLGIAVGPEFAMNGTMIVSHTGTFGNLWVRRFSTNGLGNYVGETEPFLTVGMTGNRNLGGWIGFGPDDFLYIAVGEGEGSLDPLEGPQDLFSARGKILRVARNPDPFAGVSPVYYVPAPGNPFGPARANPNVIATGLRNPSGGGFFEGTLLFADRGAGRADEINLLRVSLDLGANYGWPFFEGTSSLIGGAPANLKPILELAQGTPVRPVQALLGGQVYTGTQGSVSRHYIFADSRTGRIWSTPDVTIVQGRTLRSADLLHRTRDFVPDAGRIGAILAFTTGRDGNIYFADADGNIFSIER